MHVVLALRGGGLRLLQQHQNVRVRYFNTSITRKPFESGGHAAHLSFHGAKKYPILDPEALEILTSTIGSVQNEEGIRALFLRSTIAGADLKLMRDLPSLAAAGTFIRKIERLCAAIQDAAVPVISVIDGPCLGAGMELAAACDLRIAVKSPRTVFGMPETKVGLPSVVQAALLPGLVGWGRARELLYFGDTVGVDVMERWGFLNTVVERNGLERLIEEWETRLGLTGPLALREQKRLMRVWEEEGTGKAGVAASVEAFQRAFETNEPSMMIQKFFAERAQKSKT